MSNFRLKDPDCVFIHIPKTGGSSIRQGLWEGRYDGPEFGRVPDDWAGLFSFAFVRHPIDRLVSAWSDFRQLRRYDGDLSAFMDVVEDETIIFDERRSNTPERIRHHAIPQTHPFNCLAAAEFIGRHERYTEDVACILEKLELHAQDLPEERKTDRGHWREHAGSDIVRRAERYYAKDFEALGYDV
ncbi:MAG: sulfotransferase family 2 domain-containing protein [Pseudomonadota bacterium]